MSVHVPHKFTPVWGGGAIGGGIDVSQFNTPVVLEVTNQNTNLGLHQARPECKRHAWTQTQTDRHKLEGVRAFFFCALNQQIDCVTYHFNSCSASEAFAHITI